METNFQKIKVLVLQSNLSLVDQTDLLELFTRANDADLADTLKLFTEDPLWIEKINNNYQAKHAALLMEDAQIWEKIVKEEEKQLEAMGV